MPGISIDELKNIIKGLKIVEIGDQTYIGNVIEKGETVKVENAARFSNRESIKEWFQEINLGRTKNINLKGARSVRTSELMPEDVTFVSVCLETMQRAKNYADAWAENQVFDVFMRLSEWDAPIKSFAPDADKTIPRGRHTSCMRT